MGVLALVDLVTHVALVDLVALMTGCILHILVKLRRGSCHVAVFGSDDLNLLQPLMR